MGAASSSSLPAEKVERLSLESGLSQKSIKQLYKRFMELAKHQSNVPKEPFLIQKDFENIPELMRNPLGSRLIEAFFVDAQIGQQRRVYFHDFVKVISRFRPINKHCPHPWNSREAKLLFAFTMYDLNRSGTITKDEFTYILERMMGGSVPNEKVESIAIRTMREADRDSDGSITFQEFCRAMEKMNIEEKMSFEFLT